MIDTMLMSSKFFQMPSKYKKKCVRCAAKVLFFPCDDTQLPVKKIMSSLSSLLLAHSLIPQLYVNIPPSFLSTHETIRILFFLRWNLVVAVIYILWDFHESEKNERKIKKQTSVKIITLHEFVSLVIEPLSGAVR